MKVEILGTGCYNCIKLENLIKSVSENRESGRFFQSCQIGSGDEPEIRSAWVL